MLQYILFPVEDAAPAPHTTPLSLPTAAPSSSSLLVASAAATAAVADDDNQRGLKSSPKSSTKAHKKAKKDVNISEYVDEKMGDDCDDDEDSRIDDDESAGSLKDFIADDNEIDADNYPHTHPYSRYHFSEEDRQYLHDENNFRNSPDEYEAFLSN